MCDFIKINSIRLNGSDILIPVVTKQCNAHTYGPSELYFSNIKEPGFYNISASGGCNGYFTGNKWLWEKLDYEVIDFTVIHPSGLFYDFIH